MKSLPTGFSGQMPRAAKLSRSNVTAVRSKVSARSCNKVWINLGWPVTSKEKLLILYRKMGWTIRWCEHVQLDLCSLPVHWSYQCQVWTRCMVVCTQFINRGSLFAAGNILRSATMKGSINTARKTPLGKTHSNEPLPTFGLLERMETQPEEQSK